MTEEVAGIIRDASRSHVREVQPGIDVPDFVRWMKAEGRRLRRRELRRRRRARKMRRGWS